MKYIILFILSILLPAGLGVDVNADHKTEITQSDPKDPNDYDRLYLEMELDGIVDYTAFRQAVMGYKNIPSRKGIVTLIDFTKPSTEERLYVMDIKNRELLFVSHVAHGRNSGENYATSFSNVSGSYKSSLGFYITENTYMGGNGYSLIIDGLEKGINDKAKQRAIVIHGADYCNPAMAQIQGRLGRSLGCPALPRELNKPIIDAIKDGSILYIYAGDPAYTAASEYLKGIPTGERLAAAI